MSKLPAQGRLLRDGAAVGSVASIQWTIVDGKDVPWTGWLTLAQGSSPVAADRFTLALPDGTAGPVLLMAAASPGKAAPFCYAAPAPRCKVPRGTGDD